MINLLKKIFLVIILFLAAISHLLFLSNLPRGLYVDESSIGLNAALIAQSGLDEHQESWPVFFEAFGEYKNPLYIYLAAGIFKVSGISEFSLRLTSAIWFYFFIIFWLLFVKKIFSNNLSMNIYSLMSAAFLPWFFNLSRIAFEVISQLTLVTAYVYLLYLVYVENKTKIAPWIAGAILGLSFYSYSTARLLSGLLLVGLFLIYRQRKYYMNHLKIGLMTFVFLVPFLSFSYNNSEAITKRFREVSYLHNQKLFFMQKVNQFLRNYTYYFSPQYTLLSGDSLMRHHPGTRGGVFFTVGILSFLGFLWIIPTIKKNKFNQYLVFFLFVSPVAAALTDGDSSLRSLLLGFSILILSCFGFQVIQKFPYVKIKQILIFMIILLLSYEVIFYLKNYFMVYPQKSIWDQQSYDTLDSLRTALDSSESDVVMSSIGNMQYAHVQFYSLVLGLPHDAIPTQEPVAAEGRCVIVTAFGEEVKNEELFETIIYEHPGNFTRVKCFGNKKMLES